MAEDNYQSSPVVYRSDRLLGRTFLRLIPRFVAPNDITLFRLLLLPFVIYFLINDHYGFAFGFFLVAAFSDMLDGALARTTARVTSWGKIFDPLADKLLVGSVTAIIVSEFVNFYLALGIILIEFLLVVTAYYLKRRVKSKVIEANWSGKIKMWLQCLGLILLFIYIMIGSQLLLGITTVVLSLALAFGVVSLVVYRSI